MGFIFSGFAESPVALGAGGDFRSPASQYASPALSLADSPLLGTVACRLGSLAGRHADRPTDFMDFTYPCVGWVPANENVGRSPC